MKGLSRLLITLQALIVSYPKRGNGWFYVRGQIDDVQLFPQRLADESTCTTNA